MIEKYIGIPFLDNGDSMNGCDCYGLLKLFYSQELGILLPSFSVSSSNARFIFNEYMKQIQGSWCTISQEELYCAIAIANDPIHPKLVQHFAIYIGNGKMLHTKNNVGVVIENIEDYKSRVKGMYIWKQ